MVLLPKHQIVASTPHYEPTNSYPEVFKVVGISDGKRDYPAIKREWSGLAQRVKEGRVSSITTIWDEFGLMDDVLDADELTSVVGSTLRETMKFGEYLIFIVHGETKYFLPGTDGMVKPFLSSTVRVETIGEPITGDDGLETIKPTGKFTVQWLNGTSESGKIPDWLTEEFLLEMLPSTVPVKQHSSFENDTEPDAVACRESTNLFRISDTLPEPLKALYLYCKKKNDWLTVRDISRATIPEMKGKSVKQIRQLLGILADKKLGFIDEENRSDSAVGFKAH